MRALHSSVMFASNPTIESIRSSYENHNSIVLPSSYGVDLDLINIFELRLVVASWAASLIKSL